MAGLQDRALSAPAVRALLAGAIDYAGLFPPAALSMREAVNNYAAYRDGPDAWALGRFVVPAARLAELAEALRDVRVDESSPWPLSVLGAAGSLAGGGRRVAGGAIVDAVELRARTVADVDEAANRAPAGLDVFYEIPIERDPTELIAAVKRAGGKAKVRTGGVTPDAFPAATDLARFVVACARANVAFKATAGLHHPLRATYRLTYEPQSGAGEMFGFVNVFLAAAFAREGLTDEDIVDLLEERDASAIRFATDGIEWRGRRVSADSVARTRSTLALSFGSCSFREPLDELSTVGIL